MGRKLFAWMTGLFLAAGVAAAQENDVTATAYQTVNVRSGPDTRFEIVGRLAQGDSVPVTGRESEENRWLRVTLTSGRSGWVTSFAVIVDGNVADVPVVDETIVVEGSDGEVTVIAYGLVNVRAGPSMDYEIVGQLDVDDEARATARSNTNNDWLLIVNEEVEGWVAYFTVTVLGDPDFLPVLVPAGNGEDFVPASNVAAARFNVRLRAEPASDAEVLDVVPFDSNVTLLARSEDGAWLYVQYENVTGWGVTRLFDLTDEQLDAVPLFTPELEVTAEATPEVTPEATAEAG
jgi:uncharacterized protein YgiM (DUF1202 family)